MQVKTLFKKQRVAGVLNPKDWTCDKPRIVHVTTHVYNGERFFLSTDLVRYLKVTMFKIAAVNRIELLKVGCDYTHCHFVLRQYPDQNLRVMVKKIKGVSSREVRKRFDWLNEFSYFWAKSFYVTFYKEDKISKIFNYINNQARELHETTVPPF